MAKVSKKLLNFDIDGSNLAMLSHSCPNTFLFMVTRLKVGSKSLVYRIQYCMGPGNVRFFVNGQTELISCILFFRVSHLEELNFWLFLLGTTPQSQPWLHSPYFISWCLGSAVALIGMPVIAGLSDNDHIESYIFLAGSIGSLLITLISLKVV